MRNLPNGANWQHFVKKLMRLWRTTIWLSMLVFWLSTSGCQTNPDPVVCSDWEQHLERVVVKYHACLEDKGNLRNQLKACTERR